MKGAIQGRNFAFFLCGLLILSLGMVAEYLGGVLLPGSIMQWLYDNGIFLGLLILLFVIAMYLLRRGILGWWRSRYDTLVYGIAAFLCFIATLQTLLGFQNGHPYMFLQATNPILLILLWTFVLPPMNPIMTGSLAIFLAGIAGLNRFLPLKKERITEQSQPISTDPSSTWKLLLKLARVDVWLGSLLLVILAFIILGSPPLSAPPWSPLYEPITWLRFTFALLSAAFLNSFIFIQNQLGDLDTDRLHKEKSQLPIAAGRISYRLALFTAIGLLSAAIILALAVSVIFFLVLVVIVFFGFLYSGPPFRLKAKPFADLFIIGLAFGSMAIITSWVIHSGIPTLPIILLIGPGLFYAGTHGIHTASDYEADKKAGIQTTAVRIGQKLAIRLGLILIALGLTLLYIAIGYYTHLFWYGLLKYKTIFLFTFCGFPFFSLLEAYRHQQTQKDARIEILHQSGRKATYLLFLILLIYCLLYVFLFYPTYYPSYEFPWS